MCVSLFLVLELSFTFIFLKYSLARVFICRSRPPNLNFGTPINDLPMTPYMKHVYNRMHLFSELPRYYWQPQPWYIAPMRSCRHLSHSTNETNGIHHPITQGVHPTGHLQPITIYTHCLDEELLMLVIRYEFYPLYHIYYRK